MNNEVITQGAPALPAEWANELAKYAEEARTNERATGTFFSTKGGILTFGGVVVPNSTMDTVVLASLHERTYYDAPFGSGERVSAPLCYAFSATGIDMTPHPEADTPQSKTCETCPHNKWGSDPGGGKGKACKQMRRLAVMPESALLSPDEVEKATVGYLRIPVTSTKLWTAYVQNVAARSLPPFAVVTRIRLVPDPKTMIRVEFTHVRNIVDANLLGALAQRANAEKKTIDFAYPPLEKEDAAKTDNGKSKY